MAHSALKLPGGGTPLSPCGTVYVLAVFVPRYCEQKLRRLSRGLFLNSQFLDQPIWNPVGRG